MVFQAQTVKTKRKAQKFKNIPKKEYINGVKLVGVEF